MSCDHPPVPRLSYHEVDKSNQYVVDGHLGAKTFCRKNNIEFFKIDDTRKDKIVIPIESKAKVLRYLEKQKVLYLARRKIADRAHARKLRYARKSKEKVMGKIKDMKMILRAIYHVSSMRDYYEKSHWTNANFGYLREDIIKQEAHILHDTSVHYCSYFPHGFSFHTSYVCHVDDFKNPEILKKIKGFSKSRKNKWPYKYVSAHKFLKKAEPYWKARVEKLDVDAA